MKPRTALDITAIIGAILAVLQFLPQLIQLIKPLLDLFPHQGAVGAGAGVFAATWAAFRGYQWMRSSSSGVTEALQTDLVTLATLQHNLARQGTPEALAALPQASALSSQIAAAAAVTLKAESAEPKQPIQTQVDEFMQTVDSVAAAAKKLQEKFSGLAPKPDVDPKPEAK